MKMTNTTIIALDGEERRIIIRPESNGSRVCLEHHHPDEPIDAHYLSRGDARELAAALLLAVSGVDETEPTLDAASADWPGDGYRLLVEGETINQGDECLDADECVTPVSGAVGRKWSDDFFPMRRKMPDVCPFAPGQVLETITDIEDARYWQARGERFEAIFDNEEWSEHDQRLPWNFTDSPSRYRRSPA